MKTTGESISVSEWKALIGKGKQGGQQVSKYKNIKTTVDGVVFDSKKEASHIQLLKILEKKGKIAELVLQPKFVFEGLVYDSGRTIEYWADAQYIDAKGKRHVVDVKGVRTPVYKVKKALMFKWFGIAVEEV